jgi:hypothetical protein
VFTNPHSRASRIGGSSRQAIQPMTEIDFMRRGGDGAIEGMENAYAAHPGTAPGGTGATGLLSNDATGWSKMLNNQAQYQQMTNFRRQNPGQLSPAVNGLQAAINPKRRY